MCIRNGIEYSCPTGHVLLNPVRPFTLCFQAQHGPILRQCSIIIDKTTKSEEWCIDCWIRKDEVNRSVSEDVASKGQSKHDEAGSEKVWQSETA